MSTLVSLADRLEKSHVKLLESIEPGLTLRDFYSKLATQQGAAFDAQVQDALRKFTMPELPMVNLELQAALRKFTMPELPMVNLELQAALCKFTQQDTALGAWRESIKGVSGLAIAPLQLPGFDVQPAISQMAASLAESTLESALGPMRAVTWEALKALAAPAQAELQAAFGDIASGLSAMMKQRIADAFRPSITWQAIAESWSLGTPTLIRLTTPGTLTGDLYCLLAPDAPAAEHAAALEHLVTHFLTPRQVYGKQCTLSDNPVWRALVKQLVENALPDVPDDLDFTEVHAWLRERTFSDAGSFFAQGNRAYRLANGELDLRGGVLLRGPGGDVEKGKAKPPQPDQDAGYDAWFTWYHQVKEAGWRVTLEDVAAGMKRAGGTIKNTHAEWMAEHGFTE